MGFERGEPGNKKPTCPCYFLKVLSRQASQRSGTHTHTQAAEKESITRGTEDTPTP